MKEHDYKRIDINVDEKGTIFAVPTGQCLNPTIIIGLNILNILEAPYSESELTQLIFKTFDQCYTEKKKNLKEPGILLTHFGRKNYSKAVKKLKYICFDWSKNEGYSITPTREDLKQNNILEAKRKILGFEPKDNEIADALKRAIEESTTFYGH